MRARAALVCAAIAIAASGCPKKTGPAAETANVDPGFECNQRKAEYVVEGGFAAAEAGVITQCDDNRPRLTKWSQDENGTRDEESHLLSSDTFDDMWKVIDDTGWRYVADECENPEATDQDPIYTIEIADYAVTKTLTCQGKEIPFPYHQLVRELDVRAAAAGE